LLHVRAVVLAAMRTNRRQVGCRPSFIGGPISVEPRINDRIRVPEVRLVGPNGEQVGIVRIEDAMRLAEEADLDLVEVAPMARPPVAKLMDYGKFKYESAVKAREARKNQAQTVIKEMKLRPKIDVHDYETKKGHVVRFLKEGDKVKITIMFRGREQSRPEMGARLLQRLAEDVVELGFVESAPKLDGRNMIMVIGPHKKKADFRAERAAGRSHDDNLAQALLAEHTLTQTLDADADSGTDAEAAPAPSAPAARAARTSAPAASTPVHVAPEPAVPVAAAAEPVVPEPVVPEPVVPEPVVPEAVVPEPALALKAAPRAAATHAPTAPAKAATPKVSSPKPPTASASATPKPPTPRPVAAKPSMPKAPPKPKAPAAKKAAATADEADTPAS
jgi:translation initiation factor IF-3